MDGRFGVPCVAVEGSTIGDEGLVEGCICTVLYHFEVEGCVCILAEQCLVTAGVADGYPWVYSSAEVVGEDGELCLIAQHVDISSWGVIVLDLCYRCNLRGRVSNEDAMG